MAASLRLRGSEAQMRELRILVVDDHEVVRRGLKQVLASRPEWTIVAEAANVADAVEQAALTRPDVVVMDVGLPDVDGFRATEKLRSIDPQLEVVLFTLHASAEVVRRGWDSGAKGLVSKTDHIDELVNAVTAIACGGTFLSSELAELFDRAEAGDSPRLTTREEQVLREIADGRTTKEIANSLQISVRTVDAHR